MQAFAAETRSGAPIVVLNDIEVTDFLFRWYLEQFGERLSWSGRIDWEKARASGEIYFLQYDYHKLSAPEQMPPAPTHEPMDLPIGTVVRIDPTGQAWILADAVTDTGIPPDWRFPVKHLNQMRLVRKDPGQFGGQRSVASR